MRESRLYPLDVPFPGRLDRKFEPWQPHYVVRRSEGRKAQSAVGEPTKQAAELIIRSGLLAYSADIMQSRCERIIATAEGLGEATELEVLFQDEHPAPALRQRGRRCKPAYARADDNRVESAVTQVTGFRISLI